MTKIDSLNDQLSKYKNYQLDDVSVSKGFSEILFLVSFNGNDYTEIRLHRVIHSLFSRDHDTDHDSIYVGEFWVKAIANVEIDTLQSLSYGFVVTPENISDIAEREFLMFHIEGEIYGTFICEGVSIAEEKKENSVTSGA